MNKKHTPGPWQVGNNALAAKDHAICAEANVIGEAYGFGYPTGKGWHAESAANAQLMAAAPATAAERDRLKASNAELLELVKQTYKKLTIMGHNVDSATGGYVRESIFQSDQQFVDNLRVAIAKAEMGESE